MRSLECSPRLNRIVRASHRSSWASPSRQWWWCCWWWRSQFIAAARARGLMLFCDRRRRCPSEGFLRRDSKVTSMRMSPPSSAPAPSANQIAMNPLSQAPIERPRSGTDEGQYDYNGAQGQLPPGWALFYNGANSLGCACNWLSNERMSPEHGTPYYHNASMGVSQVREGVWGGKARFNGLCLHAAVASPSRLKQHPAILRSACVTLTPYPKHSVALCW